MHFLYWGKKEKGSASIIIYVCYILHFLLSETKFENETRKLVCFLFFRFQKTTSCQDLSKSNEVIFKNCDHCSLPIKMFKTIVFSCLCYDKKRKPSKWYHTYPSEFWNNNPGIAAQTILTELAAKRCVSSIISKAPSVKRPTQNKFCFRSGLSWKLRIPHTQAILFLSFCGASIAYTFSLNSWYHPIKREVRKATVTCSSLFPSLVSLAVFGMWLVPYPAMRKVESSSGV